MATFYVDPTAGTNGDGSEGSPFNSLQNALSGILTSFNSAAEDYVVHCLTGADDSEEPALIAVDASSSAPRVLRIIADLGHRHSGVRGTGYRFSHQIRINNDNPNVTIELIGIAAANIQMSRSAPVSALVDSCAIFDA